jgi:hypothetical protein
VTDANPGSLERRDFLKRATIIVGTAPVVVTVLASKAQAQASCSPNGTTCGTLLADCPQPASEPNPPCCTPCATKPVSTVCTCGGV